MTEKELINKYLVEAQARINLIAKGSLETLIRNINDQVGVCMASLVTELLELNAPKLGSPQGSLDKSSDQ